MGIPFLLGCPVFLKSDALIVNNSMKLCHVSMAGLWKKRLDSGVRFTRFFFFKFFIITMIDLCDWG